MSVADGRHPELHCLVERLEPKQAAIVREQILRLVTPLRGLNLPSMSARDCDLEADVGGRC